MAIKKNRQLLLSAILFLLMITGCSVEKTVIQKKISESHQNHPLAKLFKNSRTLNSYFVGFELYDPQADSIIYAQNEKKYFTPASNTKLYTFYTALNYLPAKLPALKYVMRGDSLIFWGTGDPSFLRKGRDNGTVYHFLKNSTKGLYFSDSNFQDKRFGPGWAWDDYLASWQKERTPLPMYGNLVHFSAQRVTTTHLIKENKKMQVSPPFFTKNVIEAGERGRRNRRLVNRGLVNNEFEYTPQSDTATFVHAIPYHYTPQLITKMLSDTLHKPVTYIHKELPADAKTLYSVPADTVYKHMLWPSDNFIAEQLLLVVAAHLGHPLNTRWVIHKMEHTYLKELPDAPEWFDGSGLSHYDLFTPRDMIWILQHLRGEFSDDKQLFELLAAGGVRGTLRNWFAPPQGQPPYVFAKTGTLMHDHDVSGFIRTKSGRILIFSFMNNHYVTSSSVTNRAMQKVLWYIHEHY
jgi:D-alanyl-D-alanine carboxypeptidase/D-alanyl-D-alanine-endopeptidase (penicillin-binding protein 4)